MKKYKKIVNAAATWTMSAALFIMLGAIVVLWYDVISLRMEPDRYDSFIKASAEKYGVDSNFVRAVIYTESKFDPFATGDAGEVGLMQIMPSGAAVDYAREYGIDVPPRSKLFDPAVNIDIGTWYLAEGLKLYAGYKEAKALALCRYNAGNRRARRWAPENPQDDFLENIDIESTKAYVKKVMRRYQLYQERGSDNEN